MEKDVLKKDRKGEKDGKLFSKVSTVQQMTFAKHKSYNNK